MKHKLSFIAILLLGFCFVAVRCINLRSHPQSEHKITTWDAFGYYMYLPSIFIYHDVKELKWAPGADAKYGLSGGLFYQAMRLESGTYTNKYLGGVAIMQLPFFLAGHAAAATLGAPMDGFSPPYQYALMFGAILWAILGLWFLRKILLRFFDDKTTAMVLLFLGLCSNWIQYVSIDAAQSHGFIFTLYAVMLWLTIIWYDRPRLGLSFAIGLLCGLAVISRPTELVIICIPLLWAAGPGHWDFVKKHQQHIWLCCLGGLLGMAPQLVYWQYTTGHPIHDVGSKWYFLNPWFRVLVGKEKGWFLYTPVSIMMVVGLRMMKDYPFRKAVLTFCLLNIWIIISWSDWRYGGSYSTRALVQSYPVFALALACVVQYFFRHRKSYLLYTLLLVLTVLNFYQLRIYNSGVAESFSPFLF